jgi:hypothetical protein
MATLVRNKNQLLENGNRNCVDQWNLFRKMPTLRAQCKAIDKKICIVTAYNKTTARKSQSLTKWFAKWQLY